MVAHLIPADQFLPGDELFWQAGSEKGRQEEDQGRKKEQRREVSLEEIGKGRRQVGQRVEGRGPGGGREGDLKGGGEMWGIVGRGREEGGS